MSDLIDRKIAVQGVKELFSMGDCYCDELSIVGMLNSLPSAEPEQKKRKWVDCGWSIRCSECGYSMPWAIKNFCPSCGADMRDDKDKNETN